MHIQGIHMAVVQKRTAFYSKVKAISGFKKLHSNLFSCNVFFFTVYLFMFREREQEREGEKHQCVVASHASPVGDLALNLGMCPDWELNW